MYLTAYEETFRAYVAGVESFGIVEAAVRADVREHARRRAARWSRCPALVDDVEQVLLTTLWRGLDSFVDESPDRTIASWCGARMEYAMRRFERAHGRVVGVHVYDDTIPDVFREDTSYELVEVLVALRNVSDEGVRAYALAALDASDEVVARIAMDDALVARLGWSDVAMGCRAARKRAARNVVLREATGGARWL